MRDTPDNFGGQPAQDAQDGDVMDYDVQIRPQARQSLALQVTPGGVQVLVPQGLTADSPQVQEFIRRGLHKLAPPAPAPAEEQLDREGLLELVEEWVERLGVQVRRVQLRAMRRKWGSISTAGNLTWPAIWSRCHANWSSTSSVTSCRTCG